MSSLPPDMITLILIRLPVKSLLRFRCVSKPWCAQIDRPDFINLHLTHSLSTGSNIYPIVESKGTLYSIDSDSVKKLVKIETPFINPREISLSCSCNALLLFDNKYDSQSWILFNHSTRKHFVLPAPLPHNHYVGLATSQRFNSIGYDVINDDYKVFNFLELVDQFNKLITTEARIYSLKSNLWHIVKDFTKGLVFDVGFMFEGYVNGYLHSITGGKENRTIVALDVGKETFNLIPMPNFEDKNVWNFRTRVFGGCLALLCMYPDKRNDIWVMKEYGVKESWSMLLSVKPGDPNPGRFVMPMVYSKSCNEVLLYYECQKLVWYDLEKKFVRGFEVRRLPIDLGEVCVESLVRVGGTRTIDEKKKQHREQKIKKKRDDFLSKGFKLKL